MKAKLRCKYYADFQLFQETIDSIVDSTHTVYKEQISSLIDEKVQLYDNLVPLCTNTFVKEEPKDQGVA